MSIETGKIDSLWIKVDRTGDVVGAYCDIYMYVCSVLLDHVVCLMCLISQTDCSI